MGNKTIRLFAFTLSFWAVGCAPLPSENVTIYRGGVAAIPGPLAHNRHYSYRFLERWRISHDWISGPIETGGCGYKNNIFKMYDWKGSIASEDNAPMFEWMGTIITPTSFSKKTRQVVFAVGSTLQGDFDPYTLGTKPNGDFEKFKPFCSDYLASFNTGLSSYIIKPDSKKKTDFLVDGASLITINGLQWMRKNAGSRDFKGDIVNGGASEFEICVLKIPETQYWMVFRLNSNVDFILTHPEKHKIMLDLFHDVIASVKFEKISPIVDQSKLFNIDECVRRRPSWPAVCSFNPKSIFEPNP